MPDHKYKAFISYSHADERWAKWLHKRLERYRVPKNIVERDGLDSDRLFPIFRDRDELGSSSDLSATIETALKNSENLIVVCSPEAASSRWVNEEVKFFATLGRSDRVFCFLVDGPATGVIDPSLPPALLAEDGHEPLAADARTTADGPQDAALKVAAGLLNVGFDDLKQREMHAKYQRLAMISVASIVGMLLLGALLVFAIISRNEAEVARLAEKDQREQAESARRIAEIEATTSEKVAGYLEDVFLEIDPNEKGDQVTALELLNQRAAKLNDEYKDEKPEVAAKLFKVTSEMFRTLGQYDKAIEQQVFLLELSSTAYGPNSLEVATALGGLSDLARRAGNYDDAIRYAQQALDLQLGEEAQQPLKDAESSAFLGRALSDKGSISEAEQSYRKGLALTVNRKDMDEARLTLLNDLGGHLVTQSRPEDARPLLEESVALREQVFGKESEETIRGISNLASAYYYLKEIDLAEELFVRVLNWEMDRYGPKHPETSAAMNNLANIYDEQGNYPKALELQKAVLIAWQESLGDQHPDVGIALFNMGNTYLRLENPTQALKSYQSADDIWKAKFAESHPYFAHLYLGYLQAHWKLGDKQRADKYYQLGMKQNSEFVHASLEEDLPEFLEWQSTSVPAVDQ